MTAFCPEFLITELTWLHEQFIHLFIIGLPKLGDFQWNTNPIKLLIHFNIFLIDAIELTIRSEIKRI